MLGIGSGSVAEARITKYKPERESPGYKQNTSVVCRFRLGQVDTLLPCTVRE